MFHRMHPLEGLTVHDVGRYARFAVEISYLLIRFLVILLWRIACLFGCLLLLRLSMPTTTPGYVVVVSDS